MNKTQRNRKLVKQNKRNRLINRRYSSTIKTFSKLFKNKLKNYLDNNNDKTNEQKKELTNFLQNLYSIIDKAVKKDVIHKNNAARKKSKIMKNFQKI
jgi:small subunit ribosomal protein S20